MGNAWEYAQLHMIRDPQAEKPVPVWLRFPGDTEWRKRGNDDFLGLLNELGGEGWEMVGPPSVANGVFTYKAATDVWHDRAIWIEMTHTFKRPRRS